MDQSRPEKRPFSHDRLAAIVLLIIFALSRAAAWRWGIRFDVQPLSYGWHMLDPVLLRHDLLQSLWYLHATPPVFQWALGATLQTAGESGFWPIYLLIGIGLTLSLFALIRRMEMNVWPAAALTAVFAVSPAALLYENWLYYAYPVTALLTLSTLAFHRWLDSGRARWAWLCYGCLGAVALTMAAFHLVWLLGLGILGVWAAHRLQLNWKAGLCACLANVALVSAWYLKNALLFGTFAASSWLGMNFAKVTVFQIPPVMREAYVQQGKLHKIALVNVFQEVSAYEGCYEPRPLTGFPVLDNPVKSTQTPNFNHRNYVPIARAYASEDWRSIQLEPARYLKAVAISHLIYFRPADDYGFFGSNLAQIHAYSQAFDLLTVGCFKPLFPALPPPAKLTFRKEDLKAFAAQALPREAWGLIIGMPLLLAWALRRVRFLDARTATFAFMVFNILFVFVLGNWMEQGENNRFRFSTDPMLLALFAAWLSNRWKSLCNA